MTAPHTMEEMTRAGCTTRRGIRHWESEGLLGEVERSDGDTRRYSLEQIDRAKIIAAASFGGWSLAEIKEMIDEWGPEVREAIGVRLDAQIRAAIRLHENLPRLASETQEYDL